MLVDLVEIAEHHPSPEDEIIETLRFPVQFAGIYFIEPEEQVDRVRQTIGRQSVEELVDGADLWRKDRFVGLSGKVLAKENARSFIGKDKGEVRHLCAMLFPISGGYPCQKRLRLCLRRRVVIGVGHGYKYLPVILLLLFLISSCVPQATT